MNNYDFNGLARKFAGQPQQTARPQIMGVPEDVGVGNLDRYGATPAGRQMVDQLLQRVRGRRMGTPGGMA